MSRFLTTQIIMSVATCAVFLWLQVNHAVAQSIQPGTEFSSVDAIPTAGPAEAFATYEPETGNVYLSVGAGVNLVGIAGVPIVFQNFRHQVTDEFSSLTDFGLPTPDATTPVMIFFDSADEGFRNTGRFSLGPIFAPDDSVRTASDFASKFPDARFQHQVLGRSAILAQFNVISVPEPSSLFVLTASALGVLRRRRSERP